MIECSLIYKHIVRTIVIYISNQVRKGKTSEWRRFDYLFTKILLLSLALSRARLDRQCSKLEYIVLISPYLQSFRIKSKRERREEYKLFLLLPFSFFFYCIFYRFFFLFFIRNMINWVWWIIPTKSHQEKEHKFINATTKTTLISGQSSCPSFYNAFINHGWCWTRSK